MTPRAGTLNERIVVQHPLAARDDWGERTGSWQTLGTFHASVTPTAGKETSDGNAAMSATAYAIRIRYSNTAATIDATHRIQWRGQIIDIIAAVPDERRAEIVISGVGHAE